MNIQETVALITINATWVVQLISFLILVFVLNRVMIRPLHATMQERTTYTEQLQTDVEQAGARMKNLTEALAERERDARDEAFAQKRTLEEEGGQTAREIQDRARKDIARLKDENQAAVAAQLEGARQELQTASEALAVSIMEKVLERRLA